MSELERIRAEYARRAQDARYAEWYADANAANRFIEQERDAAIRAALKEFPNILNRGARILDIGCGAGHELVKWQLLVAEARLCGIDLLEARLNNGRQRYPYLPLLWGDASALPLQDETFDVVMQFTVFSSILDGSLRQSVAREMKRVLKPGGIVLWYDYWLNPTNAQTVGMTLRQVRKLFPEFEMRVRRVTLAPPLARFLAPRSMKLCAWLNKIPLVRSHYLIVLSRETVKT